MKRGSNGTQYVVCVANRGYRVIPDKNADRRGLVRVVDESGEDYLYPEKLFAAVDLPSTLTKRFAVAT